MDGGGGDGGGDGGGSGGGEGGTGGGAYGGEYMTQKIADASAIQDSAPGLSLTMLTLP